MKVVAIWNPLAVGLNKTQSQFDSLGPTPAFGIPSTRQAVFEIFTEDIGHDFLHISR